MKTKIKRHSRSVISVLLAVCMLVSCMTVGIIATDAAKITGSSEAIGAKVDVDSSVGDNEFNRRYLYVKVLSGYTLSWVNTYWDNNCTSTQLCNNNSTVTSLGNGYYKLDLKASSDGSYTYFRGFETCITDGSTNYYKSMGVVDGQKENCINVTATNAASWTNYFPDYTLHLNYGDSNGGWQTKTFDTNGAAYIDLSGTANYEFYIQDSSNNYYKNNGTITSSTSFSTPWTMDGQNNCWITANGNGPYKFTIDENSNNIRLKVDYPSTVQIYGEVDTTSWSGTMHDMSYEGNGLYSYSGSNQTASGNVLYRFKIGSKYYKYGDSDGVVSQDSSSPTTAIEVDSDPSSGAFKFTPHGSSWTVYVNVTSSSNKLTYATINAPAYYIAGSSGLVGTSNDWDVNDDKGKMSLSSGTLYTKTFSNVAAGTYSFRITSPSVQDNWVTDSSNTAATGTGVSMSGNNITFTLSEAKSVTITFDSTQDNNKYPVTVSFGSPVIWPPIDLSEYSDSDNNSQINVSTNQGVSSNVSYYYGAGANKLLKNGDNYWITLNATDISSSHSNDHLYFSYTSNKNDGTYGVNSIPTAAANVSVDSSHDFAVSSSFSVENHFNSLARHFAGIATDEDRNDITNIGVLYNSNTNTYTIYVDGNSSSPVTVPTVDIYAKNGTLRDSTFNRFTNLANTDIVSITDPEGNVYTTAAAWATAKSGSWDNETDGYSSTYAKVTKVPVGSKVTLRTYLSGTASTTGSFQSKAFAQTHYLKAYSINGHTYQLHKPSEAQTTDLGTPKFDASDVYYEETWEVEEVDTTYMKNGNVIEITPIYYMIDNANTKTFYIDGYIGDLQTNWGTMLCVYPYYEGKSNSANAFGGYPGQPMLYWGGKFQMEVPLTVDGTTTGAQVKGLTMHNGYWDLLHRELDTKTAVSHRQTYDYDDFYKLYKEKNADTIYFWFKYNANHDNYQDGYEYTTYDFVTSKSDSDIQVDTDTDANKKKTTIAKIEAANGAEIITDYYHRQVDLFGNLIADEKQSDYTGDTPALSGDELLIVSDGYKDTYVGEYGTLWAVYKQDSYNASTGAITDTEIGKFTFLGYISSSMLYLNSYNSVNNYTGGSSTSSGRMSWSEFKTTYDTLKASYTNKPAIISYERELWNDSKDKANRSDGKWFYSMGNDKIQANIRIEYSTSPTAKLTDTTGWTKDDFDNSAIGTGGEKNIGAITKCSAYFTNTTPKYLVGKTETGEILVNNTQHFSFQANSGGTYEFLGWVRECGGEQNVIASKNGLGESNISSNDTYIARFRPVSTGTLRISHNIMQDSTYTGNGTKYLKVEVYNGDNLLKTYEESGGKDIDVSSYINERTIGYKIVVTLATAPDEDCTVDSRTCSESSFATAAITPEAGTTVTQTKEFFVSEVFNGTASTVTAIRYFTMLTKTPMIYKYSVIYHYTSRFWGAQYYTLTGDINELESAQYFTGTKSAARLTDEFIQNNTPYEKNFRQTINWNYSDTAKDGAAGMTKGCTVSTTDSPNDTFTLTADVYSANVVDDAIKAEFLLPYKYDADPVKTVHDHDKHAIPFTVYDANGNDTGGTAYAFDETSYESFTVTSQVGKLFQWDNSVQAGDENAHAYEYKLIEAAPYILYDSYNDQTGTHETVTFHTHQESSKRYYTGNSFTVDGVTYYLREFPEGVSADATHKVIKDEDLELDADPRYVVTVQKPEKVGQEGYTGTVYEYAVQAQNGDVYFFAYNMNADEQAIDNTGKVLGNGEPRVFNGQYIVYSVNDVKDGIVQKSNGENYGYQIKYFTCWNIYNSAGELVAKSYYRQFNYSGYENYTIKPMYEYSTPNAAAEASNGLSATISYIGDSRNQWKGTNSSDMAARGNYNSVTGMTDATYAGDKIFTDFAISYNYNDQQLSTITTDTADIKIGMVIEKLSPLETINGKKVTDVNYYQGLTKYNVYNTTEMENYIKYKIGATSTDPGRPNKGVSNGATHVAIGSNANNFAGNDTSELLTGDRSTMIDNKNRLQFFYTFTKSKNDFDNVSTATGNIRPYDCVYRVTSYIYVKDKAGAEQIALSSPVYLTLYDTATR